ncbi:alanine/glycine:cation symporter family protein [Shimwellia blattae]|uniref:Putative transporter YaaJ n=1 Tax=Shimwellia blattae (strain ATCC 29907 / DSM 4481 / JCM 1650 / NBRC 105725 / CDC 9005-74) TaxID=630626 RepID=I2BD01_SHIBC|nr:sodium:alanine symporter family protein [Shimwellia blattae]AFJ48405.1 putative transporter YaaJ [Shimwellia blattae DSM 4481 = NBRC 105725]GAB81101.1 putative AGCS family transporter YaaJ [Shimwellia blattae DSM 4481 = NBRC 105725]VDY65898.1 Na+/alanine symporter [Shimwellia blattae]VEC26204.1 Na+/alanine symporter [Shimwellia blattae]
MKDFLYFISEILWGSLVTFLLLGTGLWFTIRTGFVQFRYFRQTRENLKKSTIPRPHGITAFQALCTGLASRVGSGNLTGVALAISAGGPGAVFWMWVAALIGMATCFAECALAQVYKVKDEHGRYRGGPAWYIERGLGMRKMGVLLAIFLLLAFGVVFNAVQSSTIANALHQAFSVPRLGCGIAVAVLCGLVITRGMQGVARVAQWLMPLIAVVWIGTGLIVLISHLDKVPYMLTTIVRGAFGWQEAAAGTAGYTLSQALTNGVQRGLFSNEAGMGSTPNAAAAAASWPPHPASQGFVQMAGVLIDTLLICSATAAIILLSGVGDSPNGEENGIILVQQSLSHLTGPWAGQFIAIVVLLFAFTSIIANYAYAENNLVFLRLGSRGKIWLLRLVVLGMVVLGSVSQITLVWPLADVIMALMVCINLIAILMLSPVVRAVTADYLRQRKLGAVPHFDPHRFPEISHYIESDVWESRPPR